MGRSSSKTRLKSRMKKAGIPDLPPHQFSRFKQQKPPKAKVVSKFFNHRKAQFTSKVFQSNPIEEEVVGEGGPQFERVSVNPISFTTAPEKVGEYSNVDFDSPNEWVIEQMFCGDGSEIRTVNGTKRFARGRNYACGSAQGNIDSFHEVEEDSFGFHHVKGDVIYLHASSMTTRAKRYFGSKKRVAEIQTNALNEDNSVGFTDACLGYLRNNPGVSLRLNIPGRRPTFDLSKRYWMEDLRNNLRYGSRFNCLIDACVNIVYCAYLSLTRCEEQSRAAALVASKCFESHEEPLYTVASVTPVFQKMKLNLEVRKYSALLYKPSCVAASTGMHFYLVRMYVKKKTDHVVAVDAHTQVILDSEEPFPLRLGVESLLCVGGGKQLNPIVIEDREVYFTRLRSGLLKHKVKNI
ncbi:hypothetical protein BWQ96_10502 [Gracilariopsis chorda]|uniref:Uncharacterized protein n=1 Tax=Gracilariopsis chorda TaxID=448386 RepID=A0A2V3ICG2_9FLOR|nr:hypothetical protein BWQ96_10502 [Gracilariopsis chorda]|eukprot:PXF39787.1 hypothetical protein BWQ96_10502 [Gracilariopsis chorda]